jgi:hypothetical protein
MKKLNNIFLFLLLTLSLQKKLKTNKSSQESECNHIGSSPISNPFHIDEDTGFVELIAKGKGFTIYLSDREDLSTFQYKVELSNNKFKIYKNNNDCSPICEYDHVPSCGMSTYTFTFDASKKSIKLWNNWECSDCKLSSFSANFLGVIGSEDFELCGFISNIQRNYGMNPSFKKR